jgi:hypothetical protein
MESGVEQAEQDFSAVVSLILTMAIFFCVFEFVVGSFLLHHLLLFWLNHRFCGCFSLSALFHIINKNMEAPPHPVIKHFSDIFRETTYEDSLSIIAIKALLRTIEHSTATTMMGLHDDLQSAMKALKAHAEAQDVLQNFNRSSVLSLQSGCELFVRYVSRTFMDYVGNFEECKTTLLERGTRFAELAGQSREKIAELGHPFIRDGATVLTHGLSRVVAEILLKAAREGKQFNVILTECRCRIIMRKV